MSSDLSFVEYVVKPTEGGRTRIGDDVAMAPPYPGAKPSFVIGDRMDDRERLTELVRIAAAELPAAEPKKRKRK